MRVPTLAMHLHFPPSFPPSFPPFLMQIHLSFWQAQRWLAYSLCCQMMLIS